MNISIEMDKAIARNEKEFRIFDETNCDEVTPEGIQRGVMELRSRAWSREEPHALRSEPNHVNADAGSRLDRLGLESRSKVFD